MAKRSDTLETVLLAVELLRRIPRGRKVTASELHRQLKDAGIDRDLRTIQRQMEMLSEHFEIERDDRSKPPPMWERTAAFFVTLVLMLLSPRLSIIPWWCW